MPLPFREEVRFFPWRLLLWDAGGEQALGSAPPAPILLKAELGVSAWAE